MHLMNYILPILAILGMWRILFVYRKDYKEKRRKARLCKHRERYVDPEHPEIRYPLEQCNCETTRVYEMTRCPGVHEETWWMKGYHFKIDDICNGAKRHVSAIFDDVKLYSRWQILWRIITNHSQFTRGKKGDSDNIAKNPDPQRVNHMNAI